MEAKVVMVGRDWVDIHREGVKEAGVNVRIRLF